MPIPVGDLVQNQKVITVAPSTTLTDALALMIEHDFSQLPIVNSRNRPLGVVTSTSISRALLRFGATVANLNVSDATVKIPGYPADEDLLYILDNILQSSAVFILNASQELIGILTEYDTTQYFRQRAEDIVLVEDIESTLKDHLLTVYDSTEKESEALRSAIDSLSNSFDDSRKKGLACLKAFAKTNNIESPKASIDSHIEKYFPVREQVRAFKDLTLSEFIQLAHKIWEKLEGTFNIPKSTWTTMMEEVRAIRNKLVHFRGELTADERHSLRFCSDWFSAHQIAVEDESIADDVESSVIKMELVNNTLANPQEDAIEKAIRSKYSEFTAFLTKLIEQGRKGTLTLSLKEIDAMVKGKLPKAARQHANWWTDISTHSQQWLEAGWKAGFAALVGTSPYVQFSFWPNTVTPIEEPYQLAYWSHALGVSERELKEAIAKVGPDSDLVEIHITDNRAASSPDSVSVA